MNPGVILDLCPSGCILFLRIPSVQSDGVEGVLTSGFWRSPQDFQSEQLDTPWRDVWFRPSQTLDEPEKEVPHGI
jgi:hypothetical protein